MHAPDNSLPPMDKSLTWRALTAGSLDRQFAHQTPHVRHCKVDDPFSILYANRGAYKGLRTSPFVRGGCKWLLCNHSLGVSAVHGRHFYEENNGFYDHFHYLLTWVLGFLLLLIDYRKYETTIAKYIPLKSSHIPGHT